MVTPTFERHKVYATLSCTLEAHFVHKRTEDLINEVDRRQRFVGATSEKFSISLLLDLLLILF